MKKISLILCIMLFITSCSTIKDRYLHNEVKKIKTKVIVGNFYNYSRFGTRESDEIARSILIAQLKNSNDFEVIENKDTNEMIEKLAFLENEDEGFANLKKNFLDVDYVIIGNIKAYNIKSEREQNIVYDVKLKRANVTIEITAIGIKKSGIWQESDSGTSYFIENSLEHNSDLGNFMYQKLEKTSLEKAIEKVVDKTKLKIK